MATRKEISDTKAAAKALESSVAIAQDASPGAPTDTDEKSIVTDVAEVAAIAQGKPSNAVVSAQRSLSQMPEAKLSAIAAAYGVKKVITDADWASDQRNTQAIAKAQVQTMGIAVYAEASGSALAAAAGAGVTPILYTEPMPQAYDETIRTGQDGDKIRTPKYGSGLLNARI